ncbi:MAG: hypothetical protein ACLPQ6_03460 [Steroidobacteraceae bacterium]
MRSLLSSALAIAIATSAFGADAPHSYADALAIWEKHKATAEYQTYTSEFVQFNNHFHIDERSGCYSLGQEHVGLMLVITYAAGSEFAVVENVLSDVDSPKARCFVQAYRGLQTKVPPYVPFVLQMAMG